MNKTAIKNFAVWARTKLIHDISYRAGLMGITENGIAEPLPQSTGTTEFYDIGTAKPYAISGSQVKQRKKLVETIREKEEDSDYKTAYKYIMEEVAYTWFNRLIAVRFMEVNDYLPSHIRVLSSETGKPEPDLVTTPFDAELSFTPQEEADLIQMKRENRLDDAFRLLFIKQCNVLNEILPGLFEVTGHYTELLLNLSFIDPDGVVRHLVQDIDEADFNVERDGQVEIIGWLYQYYNTAPKDETFALLKKNVKITKERIPSATQVYTPNWIVGYMIENSLGRLWIERNNAQTDKDLGPFEDNNQLKSYMKYYIEEAEQEPDVKAQLKEIRREYESLKPEDIKIIDPCMGSGHILVYAFDILLIIYHIMGYSSRDAVQSILKNNLYGLDIDKRAVQLAYFAVMMKARQNDRRILSRGIQPHLYAVTESNSLSPQWAEGSEQMMILFDCMKEAETYGSIINVPEMDFDGLRQQAYKRAKEIKEADIVISASSTIENADVDINSELPKLLHLIDVAEILSRKYHIVCTNPPYMGSGGMNKKLSEFVRENYPDSKSDLFACFIERCGAMTAKNGYQAMITQHAWMFLSSYEKLRVKLLQKDTVNMAHLGARAFEEIGGEVVQTTSFVVRKSYLLDYKGVYCRLIEPTTQQGKEDMFLAGENRYSAKQLNFSKIPGSPVAYWVSKAVYNAFCSKSLGEIAPTKKGLDTGENDKYLRLWYEINFKCFGIEYKTSSAFTKDNKKWAPHDKGGNFRKWYGNKEWVINWENNGYDLHHSKANLRSEQYYFSNAITWGTLSSNLISFRISDYGAISNTAGSSIYANKENSLYLIGLLNSNVAQYLINIINPTMNYSAGQVALIPIIKILDNTLIEKKALENIKIAKKDWDSFETSWDFKMHPLIEYARSTPQKIREEENSGFLVMDGIKDAYKDWEIACAERFKELKSNEEELNRIFIGIYGLQEELTPEVEDKDITVRLADKTRDIKSFISYAVGCMFGRYSLDTEGLAYAGGGWNISKYNSFIPDEDNIIPITDEEYLEDDIVNRFVDFVRIVYGAGTLKENLDFIAEALGGRGDSSREIIRNYLLKDFFKDHCKIYQKRPIYWLFDSGRQNGFKALIYLHRYTPDTIGNLRIDYLHRMQRIYDSEINRMQDTIENSDNAREVGKAAKRKEKLQKQLKECREYDEKISHLAISRIELDLDDGVKVNYEKVQTARDGKKYQVLAKI